MYKLGFLLLAMLAVTSAKPVFAAYTGLPVATSLAYTAPGFVTASSSQFVARNYNGLLSAPYVTAAVAPAAPLVTSAAYSYAPAFVY
ncbi:hypothetical protein RUM44_004906 [Polyplax serrata]